MEESRITVEQLGETTDKVRMRRYRSNLYVAGTGVIAFEIWSLIRFSIAYLTRPELLQNPLREILQNQNHSRPETVFAILFIVLVSAALLGGTLAVRLYIGLSARQEGRGQPRKRPTYLAVTWLLIVINAVGIGLALAQGVYRPGGNEGSLNGGVVSLLVDLTCLAALVEVAVMGRRVRRQNRRRSG